MKKYNILKKGLLIIIVCILMSCEKPQMDSRVKVEFSIDKGDEFQVFLGLKDDDFTIYDNNDYIKLGDNYDEIKLDKEVLAYRGIDEKKSYELYRYEDLRILTAPNVEGNIIFKIEILTPIYSTYRGVKIGDNIDIVLKKYGNTSSKSYSEYDNSYSYTYYRKGKDSLEFKTDKDGKIKEIALMKV